VGTGGTVQRFIGPKARSEQIDAEGVVRRGVILELILVW